MRDLQAAGGTAITVPTTGARVTWLRWLCLGIGLAGLVLDQVTKAVAIAGLDPQRPIPLLGGLVTLQLIRNPGAAFSMGENATVVFTVIAVLALAGVLGWLLPRVRHTGWAVVTGFLLAGIAGNLADRLFREPAPFHGHVIDFIQLPYFAIFNVADIFITAAAVLVAWLSLVTQVQPDGLRLKEGAEAGDG